MKRPLTAVALLYIGGVLLGSIVPMPLGWLFAVSMAVGAAALIASNSRALLLACFVALSGWTNVAFRNAVLSPHDLRTVLRDEPAIVTLRGTLIDAPTHRLFLRRGEETARSMARVRVDALCRQRREWQPAYGTVAVSTPGILSEVVFAGAKVEVNGVIQPPREAVAEGLFDYGAYLRTHGIFHQVEAESTNDWRVVADAPARFGLPATAAIRRWAQATLARGLPEEDESLRLLWAMTLGWKTALTDEVSEPFMRSGTLHIFAISGLHIALIAGILTTLLRVVSIPRGICGLIVIPLLWAYTAVTGWQPSAIRSTVMASVILAGYALKRPSDLLNSMAGAAFVILLWDPRQLFQAGFQLSFAVVISIALFAPHMRRIQEWILAPDPLLPAELRPRWQRWLDTPLRWLIASFGTSLAAWLGSLPLIAHYFFLFTPVSLLANLVIVPLSFFALTSSLGSLLCGAWLPQAGELFNHGSWFWMELMVRFSEWSAALPGGHFYVAPPSALFTTVYYAALVGIVSGVVFEARWRRWVAAVAVALACVFAFRAIAVRGQCDVTVLPLAGGVLYFDAPGSKRDLLVGSGSESTAGFVTKPFLRSRGVDSLESWLVTHGDVQHIGGFAVITNAFSPRAMFLSSVRFRSPAYRQLSSSLETEPGRRIVVNSGDRVLDWIVLHPQPDRPQSSADDNALVLRGGVQGFTIVLLSELGRLGQRILFESSAELGADVVIAGIPAGGEPLGDALLDRIRPRVIVIQSAEFPVSARATVELRQRLARRGVPVFYASDCGAVTLRLRGGSCVIDPRFGTPFELRSQR